MVKSKSIIDSGFYYAPYNLFETMTWQVYLNVLQSKYASGTKLGQNREGDGLSDATEMMKKKFPGPYSIIEKYDPIRGCFTLKLKFDDPKEEIFWLLKNS